MRRYKTIIIGGGISGLACGHTLNKAKEDFLLISKDLGGRMLASKDKKTNYGASYITNEYKLTSKYIGKEERVRPADAYFYDGNQWTNMYRLRNLYGYLQTRSKVEDLIKDLHRFRKRCLTEEQKQALTPLMKKCISTKPASFAKDFEYLHKYFATPILESTFFTSINKVNLLQYFVTLFPAFIPTYRADFTNTVKKLTKGWQNKIKREFVLSLKKTKSGFVVKTPGASYEADYVVLALPYRQASKLWKVPKQRGESCYAWHVKGIRKDTFKNMRIIFFNEKKDKIYCIWGQENGSDLIFSKKPSPNLNKFYKKYKVIGKVFWDPAVVISGKHWVKQKLSSNLFIAGDYNISCLEDSFITGVYAANQIIENFDKNL